MFQNTILNIMGLLGYFGTSVMLVVNALKWIIDIYLRENGLVGKKTNSIDNHLRPIYLKWA